MRALRDRPGLAAGRVAAAKLRIADSYGLDRVAVSVTDRLEQVLASR
jgi:hypothetical protein